LFNWTDYPQRYKYGNIGLESRNAAMVPLGIIAAFLLYRKGLDENKK